LDTQKRPNRVGASGPGTTSEGAPEAGPEAARFTGLEIERVPISALTLDPANARLHGAPNLEAIKGSLARFGQAEPLVVQRSTGRVIGGNGRLVAMKELGWTECDVVRLDVDELNATALGIALNRTADLAEWDAPVLAQLLDELRAEDALDGVGYTADDIDALLAEIQKDLEDGAETTEDEAPGLPEEATSRPGDLWILGSHRLLCGDSASPDDVDRLLGGEPIHLVNTDPPYNVKVEPRSNNAIAAGLVRAKLGREQIVYLSERLVELLRNCYEITGTFREMPPMFYAWTPRRSG
jgi:ParB-like chromosome segregation protein Spo0J